MKPFWLVVSAKADDDGIDDERFYRWDEAEAEAQRRAVNEPDETFVIMGVQNAVRCERTVVHVSLDSVECAPSGGES